MESIRRRLEAARLFESRGYHDLALAYFGDALHTIQDSSSPAHSGFQEWSGNETLSEEAAHASFENLAADVWDLRSILRNAGYDRSLVNQQLQQLIELNRRVGNIPR